MDGKGPQGQWLDAFLPAWRLRQADRIAVAAPPDKAWAVVRAIDLYRFGFVRSLFGLRTWPDRLGGRGGALPKSMTLDDIAAGPAPGFRILREEPGREIVLGAIGQVWQARIPFREVDAEDWAAFQEPGYVKVAWNLSAGPGPQGGTILGVEVRVG
ncbi:MAG TPA: hypothetical protein VFR02_04175, partial [bacterium]|nr:hypothetical protein [bacterium]